MKMNKAFYGAVILVTLLCATSCNNKQFHVNGTISEAKDSILYLCLLYTSDAADEL